MQPTSNTFDRYTLYQILVVSISVSWKTLHFNVSKAPLRLVWVLQLFRCFTGSHFLHIWGSLVAQSGQEHGHSSAFLKIEDLLHLLSNSKDLHGPLESSSSAWYWRGCQVPTWIFKFVASLFSRLFLGRGTSWSSWLDLWHCCLCIKDDCWGLFLGADGPILSKTLVDL